MNTLNEKVITLEVSLSMELSFEEAQFCTFLEDVIKFIQEQQIKMTRLGALHTLIQNQVYLLKLKILTGRGSRHIWMKRESNIGENWITIVIE